MFNLLQSTTMQLISNYTYIVVLHSETYTDDLFSLDVTLERHRIGRSSNKAHFVVDKLLSLPEWYLKSKKSFWVYRMCVELLLLTIL